MKVVMVHGWDGNPENCWFPWLKSRLDMKVIAPSMPNPDKPEIGPWVKTLEDLDLGEDTVFVGHSVGCQAILRYLTGKKAKGVVLVAPWFKLDQKTIEEEPGSMEIARPWMETPIEFNSIDTKVVCILSDNDPYVPMEENKKIIEDKLNADVIVEHGKGHFDDSAGVKELPSVLEAVKKMVDA